MATNETAVTKDLLTVASGVARMNYFYGQLLTQRDLFAEQRYHLELRRLLQRQAFGTGTVAGLRVEGAGPTAPGSVFVRAGLALDPDGREILLVNDQCVVVADPVAQPAQGTLPSAPTLQALADALAPLWKTTIDPTDLDDSADGGDDPRSLLERLQRVGLTEVASDPTAGGTYPQLALQLNQLTIPANPAPNPGQLLRDVLFDALVGTTYLGLQYVERGTDPSPTVLDASCCGDATCFPSRREEGVVIVSREHPFPALPDAFDHALTTFTELLLQAGNPSRAIAQPGPTRTHPQPGTTDGTPVVAPPVAAPPVAAPPVAAPAPAAPAPAAPPADVVATTFDCQKALCASVLDGWRPLPAEDPCGRGHLPVVPIARVYWSRFPRATAGVSRILSVDNCSRPLAPGVPQVRALLAALTQCTAIAPAPRFAQFTPKDQGEITVATAMGSATATVTARATALLDVPTSWDGWDVFYYPAPPPAGTTEPLHYTPDNASTTTPALNVAASFAGTTTTEVQLVFTSSSSSTLPSGTYRWRMNTGAPLVALDTSQPIEGILEGVFFVP